MHKTNAAYRDMREGSARKYSPLDCFCTLSCAYMTIQYGLGRGPDRSHIGALTAAWLRLSQRAAWMPAVAPPRPCKLLKKLDQTLDLRNIFFKEKKWGQRERTAGAAAGIHARRDQRSRLAAKRPGGAPHFRVEAHKVRRSARLQVSNPVKQAATHPMPQPFQLCMQPRRPTTRCGRQSRRKRRCSPGRSAPHPRHHTCGRQS